MQKYTIYVHSGNAKILAYFPQIDTVMPQISSSNWQSGNECNDDWLPLLCHFESWHFPSMTQHFFNSLLTISVHF